MDQLSLLAGFCLVDAECLRLKEPDTNKRRSLEPTAPACMPTQAVFRYLR